MSSLTCSRPTSSSSMLRRWILPLLTARARIARAPIARAPIAPAPTARAPNAAAPVAARPSTTRPKAACLSEAERFLRITVLVLMILLPCPSSPWSFVPPSPGPRQRYCQRGLTGSCPVLLGDVHVARNNSILLFYEGMYVPQGTKLAEEYPRTFPPHRWVPSPYSPYTGASPSGIMLGGRKG
jgi:hypothetical protein